MSYVETQPNANVDGAPTEAEKVSRRKMRMRIANDLLLAACFKHHPDHAIAALKGIEPNVTDLDIPPRMDANGAVVIPAQQSSVAITDIVADFYAMPTVSICSRNKQTNVVWPRQICMYLIRKHTKRTLPQIATGLKLRDHTTVIHGIRKVTALLETDERLRDEIEILEMRIAERLNRPVAATAGA